MSEWQPIETAPRDGTYVLLWAEMWEDTWGVQQGHFSRGKWHTAEGSTEDNEPGFDPNAEVGEDYDPLEDKNLGPTHWFAIPRPPEPRP